MRIQSDGIIVGHPALAIRKLLRQEQGSLDTIAKLLDIDLEEARRVSQKLQAEGYIEPFSPSEKERWQTTIKGNALAHASARKPITRRTAERLIDTFLQRVREVNTCDDYVYRIQQVILFGSFLSESDRLGDVDLSLVLQFRATDAEQRAIHCQQRIEKALAEGRTFRNLSEEVGWPYQEVFLVLKRRSPYLSLHDEHIERVLSRPIPSRILFDAADEKGGSKDAST